MKKFFLIPLMTLLTCVMAWGADVATLEELKAAIPTDATPKTIKLTADINAGTNPTITFPAGTTVTLDLNGCRLYASANNHGKLITNRGNLTIIDSGTNGTIENTCGTAGGYTRGFENYGTLWLKKCKLITQSKMALNSEVGTTLIIGTEGGSNDDVLIESKGYTSANPTYYDGNGNAASALTTRKNCHMTIYCGTLKSNSHPAWVAADKGDLKIYNGVFVMGVNSFAWFYGDSEFISSNLVIYGGTYPEDPSDFVAQDYYAEKVGNVYEVRPVESASSFTVNSVADIEAALSNANYKNSVKLTLGSDIVLDSSIELPHGSMLTIPAGKTFTVNEGGVFVNNGRTINNGSVAIVGNGFFSKPASLEGVGNVVISGYSKTEANNVIQYTISTPMQLQYLAYLVLQEEYKNKTWNISLSTDINLPSGVNFEPIQRLFGTFDGNNHSINNLYMSSIATDCSLINLFQGKISNLTINNAQIQTSSAGGAILCGQIDHNTIFENVVLNGSCTSRSGGFAGFVGSAENIESAGRDYGMKNNSDYLWFVNCVSNVNITTQIAHNMGGFIGTMTETKGTFGFYNCENKGSISSAQTTIGAIIGCGSPDATIEFIGVKNSGSATSGTDVCGLTKAIGYSFTTSSINCDHVDPAIWTAVYNETEGKYVPKEAGTLDNTGNTPTTDWAQNSTWTTTDNATYVVPNAADNVTVNNNEGVVVTTTDAVAKEVTVNTSLTVKDGATLTVGEGGLTIASTATVTVEQGATLVIGEAGLTNNGKLEVKGTVTEGAGVVLFDPEAPEAKTQVAAEISITPDAHKKGENSLLYRYIGIPLYFEGSEVFVKATNWAVSDPTATIYFQEWNPLTGWNNLNAWADLVPFKGYATSNSTVNNLTYTFKGNLVGNANQTLSFAYGFNMYANSYTAPIQIQTLLNSFDENVNATIYMFDDGVVKSVSKSAFNGYEDPEFTSIPSLQAFFVLMENEGMTPTENINYANTVYNFHGENGAFYAPARNETPDFNRVRINVANENGANDAVYMIEAADFTNEFDNGYDAVKYMNTGLNLFATTAHGRQSSNYSNSIEGSFIGVQGNGTYTMSFDKLAGEEYQIRDMQTNAVVAMSEANTYTFTVNGTEDARFIVEKIAKVATAIDNVNAANMFVRDNTLYVGAANADIQIFAANGQLVLSEKAQPTVDLSGLATGVYTVRVANQSLKFVK